MQKRHRRVPRPANPCAMINAVIRRSSLAEDQIETIRLAHHTALRSLVSHCGSERDVKQVVYALNMSLVLAEAGFGEEHVPLVANAMDACFSSGGIRRLESGCWGLATEYEEAVGTALLLHDEQLAIASVAELQAADAELKRRVAAGSARVAEAAVESQTVQSVNG